LYRYSWFKFLRRFVLKRIDFIRSINELIFKQLRDINYQIERILRIPNGINSKDFIGIEKDKREEVHFGYVGRLMKFKNLRFLIKVFQEYLAKYPNDKLYIYGRGPEINFIQDFIYENNLEKNIILCGYEKEKEKIYKNIDVLIDPALAQGISNANLEAMCTGTFLIASNVQGNIDLVKHRITGLLFNTYNEKDLLKQLFTFKNDKKLVQEVIINAKKEVITNYDIDVVTNKIYKFLKSRLNYF
jgi:glycosyltransferase involved in cell wall biosynthesis